MIEMHVQICVFVGALGLDPNGGCLRHVDRHLVLFIVLVGFHNLSIDQNRHAIRFRPLGMFIRSARERQRARRHHGCPLRFLAVPEPQHRIHNILASVLVSAPVHSLAMLEAYVSSKFNQLS